MKGKHPSLAIYKREETPAHLHYRNNQRIPPILGLAEDGWRITTRGMALVDWVAGRANGGAHGYDPTLKSMHGLFVAAGPRVREGVRAPAFENVHIYNFLCALLGLKPAPNDGDPSVTERASSAMTALKRAALLTATSLQLQSQSLIPSPQSLEVL